MDHLRISTITCVLMISEDIDLEKIYKTIPISKYITFIEFGDDNTPKGYSEKAQKKACRHRAVAQQPQGLIAVATHRSMWRP